MFPAVKVHFLPWTALRACSAALALLVGLAAHTLDTATVIVKTAGGILCQISNSRRAVYGYDQRIEVFGPAGMLRAENETATRVEFSGAEAVCLDKPVYFFLERYSRAYMAELDDFVQAVTQGRAPLAGGEDGRQALVMADAALESYQTGNAVKL